MPGNIEIKLRCDDHAKVYRRAIDAGAADQGLLHQRDTYFRVPTGKLKLREIRTGDRIESQLIAYVRPTGIEPRASDYLIASVADADVTRHVLGRSIGIDIDVVKRRHLLLWHNVRIHLDAVESLGSFVELESVMSEQVGHALAETRLLQLMMRLGLSEQSSIAIGYAEMLRP
jgi:adenylate cyclase, class 2